MGPKEVNLTSRCARQFKKQTTTRLGFWRTQNFENVQSPNGQPSLEFTKIDYLATMFPPFGGGNKTSLTIMHLNTGVLSEYLSAYLQVQVS
jgi:hypothetical protein